MSKKGIIIVTGGAGFIGANLVERFNTAGYNNIIIVDSLKTGEKWKNLVGLSFVDFIQKSDFLKVTEDTSFLKKVDAIFHMGACSATTERDADYLLENNYRYTRTLAERCVEQNLRFIYASSAATYGLGDYGYNDDHEEIDKLRPLNMYGYSKHLFDQFALNQRLLSKITGLKFFNVYGPKEAHKGSMRSMILKASEQVQANGCIKLFKSTNPKYGDGDQMRDFIYVQDCVDIMYWMYERPKVTGIFNLGTGKARTWNDLAKAVFGALGKPTKIEYIDMPSELRGQYQDFTEAKMDKLRSSGYVLPFTSLEDGVRRYLST